MSCSLRENFDIPFRGIFQNFRQICISHQLLYAVCRLFVLDVGKRCLLGVKWRRVQPDIWLLTYSAVQFCSQNCVCHTSTPLAQFNHKDGLPLCAASTTEMHNRAQLLQHPNNCSVDSLRYGRRQGKGRTKLSRQSEMIDDLGEGNALID